VQGEASDVTDQVHPSFEAFVDARGSALLRHAYVLTGDRFLAEDLVQETLAHLYRRWDRVVATSSEAYVKTSVTRQFLSWRRRKSSGERPTEHVPENPAAYDATDEVAGADALWRLLATLPRKQRAILALRYYDDQSDVQIAEILGVSASNVRAQASRGLAALREQVRSSDVTGGVS
jgi:RNA polymerase sigma-70 factor (sigma-E family)